MPLLHTPRLDLVPGTEAHLRAELESREALARSLLAEVPPSWPPLFYDADAIRFALNWLAERPSDAERGFAFYYFVLRGTACASPLLIGAGGFKGGPDAAGLVEVGYSVLPEHQRRGYPLVAIDERMVHGEIEAKGSGLAYQRGVQVRAAKRGARLGRATGSASGEALV